MSYLLPADYLPHDAPMLLLESVESVSADTAVCRVSVTPEGVLAPFLNTEGDLPGWYALELMAQTVGIWSGWHREQKGQESSSLGMILGARELVCAAGRFPARSVLTITATLLMEDERFSSFECLITAHGDTLATGRVNTFQPSQQELASLFKPGVNP
ncbi:3-hydroxy-fatty acyl-ACP dehydratase [Leclercia adecarboxylata]|uniref:ApeP family dehydratase n=1 Tax=Leclercia TaxID=83654 RepID=UPI0012E9143C|nr:MULTISPECIES: 3-hydroxy-fatty acyl-ACP dehydratase [Leclercia]MEB5752254.1 3-hydroxy-fatty acyl-ACP dehydratase [Leclercia adecarboxylata]QGW19011.1 3-hydroxy-fatty acyl-ACP dehydratase [Leclercia sp. Colony189]URM22713.1 3-hydroxy-fatty acyl-ACP dehydratase [Leclercia adecarboxylata]